MSVAKSRYTLPTGQVLEIVQGDLTEETVDAIVNAANAQLAHGGGVAAAIVRRGGYQIQQESNDWVRKYGPVGHDKPAYTSAGALPCRYIIHAVGPVWGEGNADEKLASAVSGSLRVADELKLSSITMPAISTGIFGFPKERAAKIFFEAIHQYFKNQHSSGLTLVRITIIDTPTVEIFAQAAAQWQQKNAQVKPG